MAELVFEFSKLSDQAVTDLLVQYSIGLTVAEARRLETDILKRPITLTEAIAFGIEGSEHTSYRSSKKYLSAFYTQGPHVVVGPGEDAGVVWLDQVGDQHYCLVVAHESHNHPSQVVPYEGAATGVGGIVRDVVCMGAKVVAIADPLRFGSSDLNKTKWISSGVVAGIGGYGNPLGIPTLAGDVFFNESYNNNCLVNVAALGIVAQNDIIHSRAPAHAEGYHYIIVGKPTDHSGFGGAAFSSVELNEADREVNKSAVQEPNAFLERHLLLATYDLFNVLKQQGLLAEVGFKDLGAGGILCATVELADAGGYGAKIDLDTVPVGVPNLASVVKLCAETQERFMWVASPRASAVILKHYNETWDLPNVSVGAQAAVIGTVQAGNYQVFDHGEKIFDAPSATVVAGLRYDRPVQAPRTTLQEPAICDAPNLEQAIMAVLAHPAVACKKPIYEKFDKNVQGLVAIEAGLADAGVLAPLLDYGSTVGVALSVDGNPRYGKISPYWQGANAVVESMRNVAAVGAIPWCLTDCLNYGNPEKPEQMWEFVEGVRGIAAAAQAIHVKRYDNAPVPIVSGNVSLYNQSAEGSINPSGIVACIGRLTDVTNAVTFDFIQPGNWIAMVGERKNELGGSVWYELSNTYGANVPQPDFVQVEREIFFMTDAIEQGLVPTCHDISDGGLIVTLAEMCFGGRGELRTGVQIDSAAIPGQGLSLTQKLFSETGGFVFEVDPRNWTAVQRLAEQRGVTITVIGKIMANEQCIITQDKQPIVSLTIGALADVWLQGVRRALV
ncbi:MAG: phosphoribosylformylglycinamidine synthase subunit PurL [Candidatus Kerfeldbacteria bacterium]|nr:phosphoribosylformylglycinamidine synthase subunit PurL [Candidatus Kerfeldbacteria bacterium]